MKNKKVLFIIISIVILIAIAIVGYFFITSNQNNKNLEKKMITASTSYFEDYMSTNSSSSVYIVTLDMLNKANEEGDEYDLKGLEKCSKQTTLTRITIDFNTGKAAKTEVELNC